MGRSETARRKVVEAGVDVLHDGGVPAFTVETIANRSGVAKTTIYRHWPSVDELLVDTLRSLIEPIPTPNTGSLTTDLEHLLAALVPCDAAEVDARSRLLFSLLHAAADDPGLKSTLDALLLERATPIRTVIELARARGEVDADLDLDTAVDLVEGPYLHRFLFRRAPVDAGDVRRMLRHVIAGLRG